MTTPRTYHDSEINLQQSLILSEEASRHLLRVLRFKVNDPLTIFNGKGGEYQAHLKGVEKKHAIVEITSYNEPATESSLSIHLGQGISRGERMDYVVQKSVELGANKITPLFTERCGVKISEERLIKRMQHWQSVAISACEQSGRCLIPEIMKPMEVSDWLAVQKEPGFVCDPKAKQHIADYPKHEGPVPLLIGPEGGLTEQEIQDALGAGFQSLSLGPRILRTETATVVALTLLQQAWGDL